MKDARMDNFSKEVNSEDTEMSRLLKTAAVNINVDPLFKADLERHLTDAYQLARTRSVPSVKQTALGLGWAALMIALVLLLNWTIRALAPIPQPAVQSTSTPPSFCPVTQPNGSLPPGETVASPEYLGNGELWTVLWPKGKIYMLPENNNPDGSFSMKWGWWRAVTGQLTIAGRRLDAEAKPLRVEIPDGYGDTGFQVSALIFPTTGCWEVTGRVGGASLTFVTEVVFGEATPTPKVRTDENATPIPSGDAYDWHGTKLYLAQPLPDSPAHANIYLAQPEEHATLGSVRALAQRFDMRGQIYETPPELGGSSTNSFLVMAGSQRLIVRSDQYFQFYPDYPRYIATINGAAPPPDTEVLIDQFLKAHGFDFPYRIASSEMYGGYLARPLTPEGYPICYEYFNCAGLRFTLDEKGILAVDGALPSYVKLGQYAVLSAEEAFQTLRNPATAMGMLEGMHSPMSVISTWLRPRSVDQTLTVYGWLSSVKSLDGGAPLVTFDGYTATGNLTDVRDSMPDTFVEATGRFHNKNGVDIFEIEAWKVFDGIEDGLLGTIQRRDEKVMLTTMDGEVLRLPDLPLDVPLPLENAFVIGVRQGGTFEWKSIDLRDTQGGGGGGSGGGGFFKLNLTGTPVPFPMPVSSPPEESAPRSGGGEGGNGGPTFVVQAGDSINSIAYAYGITAEELMRANGMTDPGTLTIGQILVIPGGLSSRPQKFEGLRGMLSITIYQKPDGSQRVEYGFIVRDALPYPYLLLEGETPEVLHSYQDRPVDVWGTLDRFDSNGTPILKLERYEVPFPELQFQILKGTERKVEVQGQTALLFLTENGKSYVQLAPNCYDVIGPESAVGSGRIGEPLLLEALVVPDLTFGEYPAICVFSTSMAISPKSGQPVELFVTADQIPVIEEPPLSGGLPLAATTATIERVELVYYMPDPRYLSGPLEMDQRYLQPAWRFVGHYSNGDEFFILVQALKDEFLFPEAAPYTAPG